ncbi:hypothetical protein ACQKL5_08635 [Peribacillus sp. NPDC097675]|uniref:hypothetical protein n=1 Tax=Peribacillus sp. NPDC097675 TaxID=3390618 RepID=UPI003D034BB7
MVIHDMLEAPYKNPEIKKQILILKRSKKKRIKNKAYTKILLLSTKEFPVLSYKGLALINYDHYMESVNHVNGIKEELDLLWKKRHNTGEKL